MDGTRGNANIQNKSIANKANQCVAQLTKLRKPNSVHCGFVDIAPLWITGIKSNPIQSGRRLVLTTSSLHAIYPPLANLIPTSKVIFERCEAHRMGLRSSGSAWFDVSDCFN